MPPKVRNKNGPMPTTAQSLAGLLKSARDIMRKDKGLNGDIDRLPMLTWILFLKFLDDLEQQRAEEAALAASRFRPAVDSPYRWRDWAADPQGITGDTLLAFINQDECTRPDGKRGPGLFAYLRSLTSSNGDERRDVIATVFKGVQNRMASGYLLRDVINKVAGIHFGSSDELHTLGALYESLLREMRDAAGDSGEFYTPRPVVRFMVAVSDPHLGEVVLDPACGTGGFLVEAFNHLSKEVHTVHDRRVLQERSLLGCEPKPLPYLLCQMNLLLHGLDSPRIDAGNALGVKLTEIGDRERVDVILTNPPFGGEEEKGIQSNFPEDRQTAETALLFLQLIMRKLRKARRGADSLASRAAVVVPNGILSGDGVCARIKKELLEEFNLHTIVRLPNGVFAPYTSIPTNVLFFDRKGGPTKDVWYYEHPLPEGRKNYTKTQPLQYEEFLPCLDWWKDREENDCAWKVGASELLRSGCNLDRKNPHSEEAAHLPPEELLGDVLERERRFVEIIERVANLLRTATHASKWHRVQLSEVLRPVSREEHVEPTKEYRLLGVRLDGRGPFLRETVIGSESSATRLYRVCAGDFIYSRLFACRGAFGIVSPEYNGCYVSNEFPTYTMVPERIDARYLRAWFLLPATIAVVDANCTGSTPLTRNRFKEHFFLALEIPLPTLEEQRQVVARIEEVARSQQLHSEIGGVLDSLLSAVLDRAFRESGVAGGERPVRRARKVRDGI